MEKKEEKAEKKTGLRREYIIRQFGVCRNVDKRTNQKRRDAQKRKYTRKSCPRLYFFFQAEDVIRDRDVTGVQTCALPISSRCAAARDGDGLNGPLRLCRRSCRSEIGRASCRGRVEISVVALSLKQTK